MIASHLQSRFVTDGSVQNHGFQMNYTTSESLCGGILKEEHGVIQVLQYTYRVAHPLVG